MKQAPRRRFLCRLLLFALPLAPAPALAQEASGQVQLEAEHITNDGVMTRASGDVKMHFADYQLCAGEIEYDRSTGLVRAVHDVRIVRRDIEIQGERASYNVQQQQGDIHQFNSRLADSSLHLTGGAAAWRADGLVANNVGITSCPQESQDWRLHVADMQTLNETQQIIMRNATLEVLGVPVFYIPYGQFYYGQEKHSGFLQPDLHLGTGAGLGLTAPYYFALADNYDLTITPNYRGQHGLELGGAFRFLTKNSSGDLNLATAFFDDEGRGHERLKYLYDDGGWRVELAAENVSDSDYLRDYVGGDEKSVRTLPRAASVSYEQKNLRMQARVEHFQSLDGTLTAPHRALPQVEIGGGGGSERYDWRGEWQYSRFAHNTLADGSRHVWRGSSRYYHWIGDFLLSPGGGVHAVKYVGGDDNDDVFFVPYARLDIEKNLGQIFSAGAQRDNLRLRAALVVPRVHTGQNDAPLYDSEARELTAQNLFEENRFVGGDRAPDAKFIVYGGGYRLFNRNEQQFFIGAAQRYYFQQARAATPTHTPPPQGFGNILLNSRLLLGQGWDAAVAAEWNAQERSMEEFYTEVHGEFANGNLVHLRYNADEEESLVIGASTRLGDWLEVAAQTDYLLDGDRFTRSRLAGRLRDSCNCWSISFTISDTVAAKGDNETEYSLGVEFVGLGNVGNDYESLLDDLR